MSGDIDASVRLELTSRPEAARLVRSMSSAAGEALGFDSELLNDVNTAVTEACNNVILHAYSDQPGPMWVELATAGDRVEVRIRDYGFGIREDVPEQDGLKVGLALMSAVAERAEFVGPPEGGTEVRLTFRDPASAAAAPAAGASTPDSRSASWRAPSYSELPGEIVLTVSPVALLGPVLGRIGRTLAPSAGFSLERCYDVYLLTDALGAHAERAAKSSSISVALAAHDRLLEFAVSPLRRGTSDRLEQVEPVAIPKTLARLTDTITVTSVDSHETLTVSMRDHRRT